MSFLVIFSIFFSFRKKNTLCCHSRCLSVVSSVRLFVVCRKNTLERGCTMTNKPINLKFDLNIGGGVFKKFERSDFSKFKLQVANFCNFFLVFTILTNIFSRFS